MTDRVLNNVDLGPCRLEASGLSGPEKVRAWLCDDENVWTDAGPVMAMKTVYVSGGDEHQRYALVALLRAHGYSSVE